MRNAGSCRAVFITGVALAALVGLLPGPWGAPARAAEEIVDGAYWALIIGVDKYPLLSDDKQLTSARKDAAAVAALLRDRYGFPKENVIELYDEAASRKAIIKALTQLKRQLTAKDSLFVYFAGYGGVEGKKGKGDEIGYWVPSDAELDDPSSTVFNTQMRDYFSGYPARHVFLVSDSVFSGSLIGKTVTVVHSKAAAKELSQTKSRWVLASGTNFPVTDPADTSKKGHGIFAWHFMKVLEANTKPYLFGADVVEDLAVRVSNEKQGKLPRSAPIIGAGDEGGQFVFRLLPEFRKGDGSAEAEKAKQEAEKSLAVEKAKLDAEKAKTDAAQKELEELERQLKQAEEALKKGK